MEEKRKKQNEYHKLWYQKNKDRIREKRKAYMKEYYPKYREQNREKYNEYHRIWEKNNRKKKIDNK